jgi:hypothetical protein
VKLPNVGREGHTFSHHIVENYDTLPNITVFLQGRIDDHQKNGLVYADLKKYIYETDKYGFSTSRLRFFRKTTPQIIRQGKFLEARKNGSLAKAQLSFSEFYQELFHQKQPLFLPLFYGANFAVAKPLIYKREKQFYKKIVSALDSHYNPEEGHYVERLWFTVFNHHLMKKSHFIKKLLSNPFVSIQVKLHRLLHH